MSFMKVGTALEIVLELAQKQAYYQDGHPGKIKDAQLAIDTMTDWGTNNLNEDG